MASTTSGSTTFSIDVDELIEQALEPLGGEHQSGVDSQKARRVLNLLLITMQNKNIPLSKIATIDLPLTQGTATYTLDASIVDVLEATITNTLITPVSNLPIQRYGVKEYHNIPNKTVQNRPNTFVTNRLRDAVTITFWPVPNLTTYTANLLAVKKIEDINASYQRIDLNTRYLPLMVKWLSYELALSRQNITEDVRNRLKMELKEIMPDTFEEDRERSDFTIKPGGIRGR